MLTCAPMFKVWESEHAFGRFLFLSRFRHWRRPSSTVAGNNASKLATAGRQSGLSLTRRARFIALHALH